MSVKFPLGLVLYCYFNMPTINKTYLILSHHRLTFLSVSIVLANTCYIFHNCRHVVYICCIVSGRFRKSEEDNILF